MRSSTIKAAGAPADIAARLAVARSDLSNAIISDQKVADEESDHLGSDHDFVAWTRRKRVAENDKRQLADLVASLEAQLLAAQEAKALADHDARYNAAADANERVAEQIREDLPKAWAIIAGVMRAAALAEIETASVLRASPTGYRPRRSLADPDRAVRCRPTLSEEVLSDEKLLLWVDPKTGNLFADQSAPPRGQASVQRPFRVTTYVPYRRGTDTPSFARGLVFPRLGNAGGPLFDGAEVRSSQDVLDQISAAAAEVPDEVRAPQKRIEAMP